MQDTFFTQTAARLLNHTMEARKAADELLAGFKAIGGLKAESAAHAAAEALSIIETEISLRFLKIQGAESESLPRPSGDARSDPPSPQPRADQG